MATTPQQGIMALPETDEATTPQLSLNESYGAAKEGLADADPQYLQMYDDEMAKAMPALLALTDEQLDAILQLVQEMQNNPEEYAQNLKELEQEGIIQKGDFPEQYDENFLAVFGAAVLEAQRTNEDTGAAAPTMQPPMQLAKGGIAEAARMVSQHGRSGDTMLAHITKKEADLLKKHGGMGTRNPRTGLQEYGLKSFVKSVAKATGVSQALSAVGGAVKKVLSSSVGRIVATVALAAFIGPAAFGLTGAAGVAAQMGLASAGITALGGGNLKDIVRSGVTGAVAGYGGAALGPAIGGSVGVTSAAGQAALGAGLTSTGLGVATGSSIKDAVKNGMISAALAGGMSAANSQGLSRGTTTQDGSNVPVSDAVAKPVDVASTNVNPQTGQVTGGAPVAPASSNAAFEQALANNQTPISGLTMDNGLTGVQPPVAQAPVTSADPLGDFIQQNEAFRTAANTPVPKPEPSFWDQTKQAYNEYLSPSGREQAGIQQAKADALTGYKTDLANGVPQELAAQNYKDAIKAGTPGVISTYGPAVAAGLGATAMMGGFNSEQPQPSQASQDVYSGKAARDIIAADPTKYLTQNLPGVSYDAAGNITGSSSWTPRSGAGTTTVPGNYIAYSAPQAPAMLPNFAPAAQPRAQYDFTPRYAAQGGMMETQGAFPSNPLSMPSSPLMAMDSQRLPMNTPGVPMNMPMGFANGGMPVGGIASLAVGGYPRRTGQIDGPGTETSDDIPAMLSDGEFVMTAKAVKGLGGGSRRAGAKKMYALMHHLEKNAARG